MKIFTIVFLFLFLFFSPANSQKRTADLIVTNAFVRTMDDKLSRAQSIAVSGNKIIFVGKDSDAKKFTDAKTNVIDAKGKVVIPGFNDAHVHILGMGNLFSAIDLRFIRTPQEMVEKIKYQIRFLPKNRWVLGGQWSNENWSPNDLPNKNLIDAITPDNPVFLYNQNPKIAFTNSAALKLAGINEDIKNPANGEFVRDKDGKLTGVLKDCGDKFCPPRRARFAEQRQICRRRNRDQLCCRLRCHEYAGYVGRR